MKEPKWDEVQSEQSYKEIQAVEDSLHKPYISLNTYTATLAFKGNNGQELIRFEANGDIFVREVFVENDKDVVDGLRDFLRGATGLGK